MMHTNNYPTVPSWIVKKLCVNRLRELRVAHDSEARIRMEMQRRVDKTNTVVLLLVPLGALTNDDANARIRIQHERVVACLIRFNLLS
jgi:hypothetical protein